MTLPPFRPVLWLRGGHAQTIGPALLPGPRLPAPDRVHDVPVAAGTSVRMLVSHPGSVPRGTLLLVHGLGGSAHSRYIRRTAAQALERGYAVARLNLRNCGGTEALATTLYNAGQSGDADAALAALESLDCPRPHALVGFSLGGNIVLRYAGLSGSGCRADAVIGVNPPVDLERCLRALERPANRIYQEYFVSYLCDQIRRIRSVRALPGPPATRRTIRTVRGFDEAFTAPDGGYADAAEYYRVASAGPTLAAIRRPAWILSAADDPFVPVAMFDGHDGEHVRRAHPATGGHVGYWRSARPRFWAAAAALAFLDELFSAPGPG